MEIVQKPTRTNMCCHKPIFDVGGKSFHWHEHYELCQILTQPCRFLVNGQLIHAQPGDIIAINEQIQRYREEHGVYRIAPTKNGKSRVIAPPLS